MKVIKWSVLVHHLSRWIQWNLLIHSVPYVTAYKDGNIDIIKMMQMKFSFVSQFMSQNKTAVVWRKKDKIPPLLKRINLSHIWHCHVADSDIFAEIEAQYVVDLVQVLGDYNPNAPETY